MQRVQSPRSSRMPASVSFDRSHGNQLGWTSIGRGKLRCHHVGNRRLLAAAASPARWRHTGSRLMPSTPISRIVAAGAPPAATWFARHSWEPLRLGRPAVPCRRPASSNARRGRESPAPPTPSTAAGAPRRQSRPTMRHDVGVDFEPGAGLRDVVGHDEVGLLGFEFSPGARPTTSVVSAAKPTSTGRREPRARAPLAERRPGCPASCAASASTCSALFAIFCRSGAAGA